MSLVSKFGPGAVVLARPVRPAGMDQEDLDRIGGPAAIEQEARALLRRLDRGLRSLPSSNSKLHFVLAKPP